MYKIVILICTTILLPSCLASFNATKPNCVPTSLYCAVTYSYQKQEKVRIAIGDTKNPFLGHAQAQYFNKSEKRWIWLERRSNAVDECNDIGTFYPKHYMTISEFVTFIKNRKWIE